MNLKLFQKNDETILAVTFHGNNRNSEVLKYQQKVFEYFNFPVNYIEWPFHQAGHGDAIQWLINQTLSTHYPDYYLFIDMDAVALRSDFIDDIYDKIKDKKTVFGPCWTSNHKSPNHIHAAACFLAFSKEMYLNLGKPEMRDVIPRSDTGEELSYLASEKGYNVSLVYPSHFYPLKDKEMEETGNPRNWLAGGRIKYGLCTTYSDIFLHCGMQNIKRGNDIFIKECKKLLEPSKLEIVTVCVNHVEILKITYAKNRRFADHFIVVTAPHDKDTISFCEENSITCGITDRFYDNGATFDKGAAINEGFKLLKHKDWVLHLDADVVLPDDFRFNFNSDHKNWDKNKLYGASRWFIKREKDWKAYSHGFAHKKEFEHIDGGDGCGYFQMFHWSAKALEGLKADDVYPSYPDAGESDIMFLKRFHPDVKDVGRTGWWVCHLGGHGVKHDGTDDSNVKFFS